MYYEQLTLWEHVMFAASVHELDESLAQARVEHLLRRFRLDKVKHHLPGSFSKGMLQKMMIIIGFMLQPDVYIVDEPFIGLDPRATIDLIELLNEERERGAAVLMSTHVLDTAEKICDCFLLLNEGRTVAQGTLPEIRLQAGLPCGSLMDCFGKLT